MRVLVICTILAIVLLLYGMFSALAEARVRRSVNRSQSAPAPRPVTPAPSVDDSSPMTLRESTFKWVESTAYCLEGNMAGGKEVFDGAVAMDDVPFGTRFRILTGIYSDRIVAVEDRTDGKTEFDIWVPSCAEANDYGRRIIKVQRLP